jgi:hypothetical protein
LFGRPKTHVTQGAATALPSKLKMEDRERFEEVKKAESVNTMIHNTRCVLKEELLSRCFPWHSSNSHMVQLYMSKQMDAKGMLTNEQYKLARTLYIQWLRKANNIVQLPTSESSPHKKQKTCGPSLFCGASLVEGLEGSPAARSQNDVFDPVTDEIE